MNEQEYVGTGTRFRLFLQAPYGSAEQEPETVWVSSPAGSVGPGPADPRMYVIDPIGKQRPYGLARGHYGTPFLYLPPWDGQIYPPAMPGPGGHFDHLAVGTAEFEAAHVFGTVRFVLDVWQRYFGRPVPWHFERDYRRLEISQLRQVDNAFAGYGFLEVGAHIADDGDYRPFSLNFDVIAHEVGHLTIYSEVGLPDIDAVEGEFFGFHEAIADVVALLSVLHFDSLVDELLINSRGNLDTFNELNRFGELSDNQQIRLASNPVKLSEFEGGWSDEHELGLPLLGAMFDILVDVFHESLLARGLVSPEVEDLADRVQHQPEYVPLIHALFDQAYGRNPGGFREALLDARNDLGTALAGMLTLLSPNSLNYDDVGNALLAADRELTGGRYQRLILNNFRWRDIGTAVVGPRLTPPGAASHAVSDRTTTPREHLELSRMPRRERRILARQGLLLPR
jgi:hypothetical protein